MLCWCYSPANSNHEEGMFYTNISRIILKFESQLQWKKAIFPLFGFWSIPNLRTILTTSTIYDSPAMPKKSSSNIIITCTTLGKYTYCPRIKNIYKVTSFHTKRVHQCNNLPTKAYITCEFLNLPFDLMKEHLRVSDL